MEQGDTDMRMESPREWQASRVFASVLLVMYFVLAFSVFSSLSPLPIVIDAQADQVRPMTLEEMSKQFYDIREHKGHFDISSSVIGRTCSACESMTNGNGERLLKTENA
ncbi:MAG: hypothetical protein P8Z31_04025, partial [Gammaproteobacteria bacterium]